MSEHTSAPSAFCRHERARRPAQRRDRRARRPRQDHARRRHAPADRLLRLARARGRARDGLERPRARKGHHDPRQEHGDHLHGHARDRRPDHDQRDRHPRPRRLRRRGRARPVDGRRRRAARRRVARVRCRRPASCCARRSRRSFRSSCSSTRPTVPTRASPRSCDETPRPAARPRERPRTTTCPTSTSTRILDVPVVYASGRSRRARRRNQPENGTLPDNDDLEPLFEAILEHVPAPDLRRRGARCRRTSPTSTPRRSSVASRCCASSTARSRRARPSPGCAPTAPCSNVRDHRAAEDQGARALPGRERRPRRHRRRRRLRGHHDRRDARRPRRRRVRCR